MISDWQADALAWVYCLGGVAVIEFTAWPWPVVGAAAALVGLALAWRPR